MAKKGRGSNKSTRTRKDIVEDEFDDEIDAFHKRRDIVPLDVNDDESDESDDVQPVFDLEGEDDDDDDDDDDEDEDENGLTAKMIRQKKYLRAKFGDGDDDVMNDDDDDDDEAKEEKRISWGRTKSQYYNADNVDDPEMRSSDDEDLKAEEEEVMRIRAKQAASITRADVGLDDSDEEEEESDRELTMEEIAVKGKKTTKSVKDVVEIEEIKKDINSLSKEEQMEVVYSSAPEIVGLLSELNDAVYELENKINPVMNKLKESEIPLNNGGGRYLEVKQSLLLSYCQYITFYLLLKSEGQPIRDHPVLARLVEIKSLLDQVKELDGNLPVGFEESLAKSLEEKVVKEDDDSFSSSPEARITEYKVYKVEPVKTEKKKKGEKRKHQVNDQSEEMLKLRAALEGKLRSDGVLASSTNVSKSEKAQKRQKLANGKLETFDDYVDDATEEKDVKKAGKLSKFAPAKKKFISGDDDLPQRDDIGERRRKFELRVLAGAGVKSEEDGRNDHDNDDDDDDVNDMVDGDNDDESNGSEDEFYKEAKQKHVAKRAAKEEMYSRKPSSIPSLPETVEGKRLISREIQSNRGLTRQRNKDLKNPRKKYRIKHAEKVKRRGGQVRAIKKQQGHYGGEEHGINAYTSKSIRIKS